MRRYTISVDFDGVLHSYTSGFQGVATIADPPVSRAIEWLGYITDYFDVAISSARSRSWRGRRAMKSWVSRHVRERFGAKAGTVMSRVSFPRHKPAALIYIDDRAYRFTGDNEIHMHRPWVQSRG